MFICKSKVFIDARVNYCEAIKAEVVAKRRSTCAFCRAWDEASRKIRRVRALWEKSLVSLTSISLARWMPTPAQTSNWRSSHQAISHQFQHPFKHPHFSSPTQKSAHLHAYLDGENWGHIQQRSCTKSSDFNEYRVWFWFLNRAFRKLIGSRDTKNKKKTTLFFSSSRVSNLKWFLESFE